jgi:hypothetical protein
LSNYILNEQGEVVPCENTLTWAKWFETADRTVAKTQGQGWMVSTVFLGMDHQFGDGPPMLWETLVFGGPLDGEGDRYATAEEARAGHETWVAKCMNGSLEDQGVLP